ncbi:hypothetical protein WMY93_031260 [Mugilogobius chulae]|uniref:Uncharacterized protein n=1 Tax=Mugilogobius chulae TaxID=88201 RepID=A0AAW0MIL2_9GOBI
MVIYFVLRVLHDITSEVVIDIRLKIKPKNLDCAESCGDAVFALALEDIGIQTKFIELDLMTFVSWIVLVTLDRQRQQILCWDVLVRLCSGLSVEEQKRGVQTFDAA